MEKIELNSSEVNLLVAALMITSVRYESTNKTESERYKDLELKIRGLVYNEDEIKKVSILAN